MSTLVIVRHGQSAWNAENRFTGWIDVDLSPLGEREAIGAGRLLAAEPGLRIDVCHTSLLTRSIRTADLCLHAAGLSFLPVRRHWRLNERHYGALQGLDKAETAILHGADQVKAWRRSYDVAPPPLDWEDHTHPRFDPRYRLIPASALPPTESLADVVHRLLPYYEDAIAPELLAGNTVVVFAHGNSLRALVKHLEGISDDEIVELEIPTGVPRVYDFDDSLRITRSRYLGSS
jgi:2,3-bisphosphoglycerate-dependent phosphoglycerate mutase